jgi:hypothetical protein
MSLFGESTPANNARSLKDYVGYLGAPKPGFERGIPPHAIITRLTFDDSESVPVVRFGVSLNAEHRAAFLSPVQISAATVRSRDADVLRLLDADAQEYAGSAPVEPEAHDEPLQQAQPVSRAAPREEPQQQNLQQQEPQEPLVLDHPDVPEDVREWARHPAVTEQMVLDHLREAYPQALEVSVAPPPPPPKTKAPPPPPPLSRRGAAASESGAVQGTVRRARRAPKEAANDDVNSAQQQAAPRGPQRGPQRAGGFVPPAQESGTVHGFAGMDGGEDASAGSETGLGEGGLEARMDALLRGTTDDHDGRAA